MWKLIDVEIDLSDETEPIWGILAFEDKDDFSDSLELLSKEEIEMADELLSVENIRSLAEKLSGAADEYGEELDLILSALGRASELVKSVSEGSTDEVEVEITKWEDVNRTLGAIKDLDEELKSSGIRWEEVLDFSVKVLSLVAKRLLL